MRIIERQELEAERAALEQLLKELPADRVLERRGLEARVAEIVDELKALRPLNRRSAEVALTFGGAPVVGTQGIEAKFASAALESYQEFLSRSLAGVGKPLSYSGPVPSEKNSRLHITNVVRGSFGFELQEMALPGLLGSPLADAVDYANLLIQSTTDLDDETFRDVFEEVDDRVYAALREFFELMRKSGATFRITSEKVQATFDAAAVEKALERMGSHRETTIDQPFDGTFYGTLLGSGRFEHKLEDGEVIWGKISQYTSALWFKAWTDRKCTAYIRTTTWVKSGRTITRYVLLQLRDPKTGEQTPEPIFDPLKGWDPPKTGGG